MFISDNKQLLHTHQLIDIEHIHFITPSTSLAKLYHALHTFYESTDLRLVVLLGAFAKLLQATINCALPVRPPAWNNSAQAERVFVKFYVREVLLKSDEKI